MNKEPTPEEVAEQILNNHLGVSWYILGDHRKEVISAMLEYGQSLLTHVTVQDGREEFGSGQQNNDVASVATLPCTDGNSIEQAKSYFKQKSYYGNYGKPHISEDDFINYFKQ